MLSTHVEVVHGFSSLTSLGNRALHARGGGPTTTAVTSLMATCSPRTWRWSDQAVHRLPGGRVLSTHVEVVRNSRGRRVPRGCALHARGGGPPWSRLERHRGWCSPRTWRWSGLQALHDAFDHVLSTHVEVVRPGRRHRRRAHRALHARGGGPVFGDEQETSGPCSPRTWRWSVVGIGRHEACDVLSTHVEVVVPSERQERL